RFAASLILYISAPILYFAHFKRASLTPLAKPSFYKNLIFKLGAIAALRKAFKAGVFYQVTKATSLDMDDALRQIGVIKPGRHAAQSAKRIA
ncbi:MAG: hypothetical protein ACO4A5_05190, partial [Candidatus Puniceispirillaceae bacterium]